MSQEAPEPTKNHTLFGPGIPMSQFLTQLLEQRCNQFDGQYGEQLSNHLPMALIALSRHGATDTQLDEFFAKYARRLRPKMPADLTLTTATWKDFLGKHVHHDAYVRFFAQESLSLGREKMLRTYVPQLVPGLAGGAFHGVIRSAYGIDADCDSEIAEGLAHWAVTYLPLSDEMAMTRDAVDPYQALASLSSDSAWDELHVEASNIFGRMIQYAVTERFQRDVAPLPKAFRDLQMLSRLTVDVYATTADFTALHLVTTSHALRLLLPYCGDLRVAIGVDSVGTANDAVKGAAREAGNQLGGVRSQHFFATETA